MAVFQTAPLNALSLGLINGDLFSDVIAFSPGFIAPGTPKGRPRLFISHGARDEILPVDRCSRRLIPALEKAEYAVDYFEFDGGHAVPPEAERTSHRGWRRKPRGAAFAQAMIEHRHAE